MSSAALSRIRHRLCGAPLAQLTLLPVPQACFGRRELLLVLATVAGLFILFSGSALIPQHARGDELAEIQDAPKPPEPKVQPQPPQPPPPPEAPKDETPPPADPNPPAQLTPDPPPQFGLPEGATADNGAFAVASGNTVMAKADAVTKAPAPPLTSSAGPHALNRPPEELVPVVPTYPAWAEERGVTAVVVVQVVIDSAGKVTAVSVVHSGGSDFDRAVRKSLVAAHYRPYVKAGHAVPAVFERRFDFRLD